MLYLHRFCRGVTFECFRLDRLLKKFLTYPCQDTAANFRFRLRVRRRRGEPSRVGRSGAAAVGLWVGPHRTAAMEALYRLPFAVLECPNIKLKRPSWVHMPSAMTVYALVVVSYFLITGGEAGPAVSGTPRLRSSSSSAPGGRATAAAADPLSGSKWGVKREPRSAPSVPAASGQFSLFAAVRQR